MPHAHFLTVAALAEELAGFRNAHVTYSVITLMFKVRSHV